MGDILENLKYFEFASKKEIPKLLEKWNYFLKVAKLIKEEVVYKDLSRKLSKAAGGLQQKIIKK